MDFPRGDFHITDNASVERFLLQIGVRERFEFPPDAVSNSFFYTLDDHPTHWLVAARFRDYPDPDDNGFMLVGWDKEDYSAKEATKLALDLVRAHGIEKPERTFIFKKEQQN